MYTKAFTEQVRFVNVTTVDGNKTVTQNGVDLIGSKTGQRVAGYKELIRQGLNASSPFSCDLLHLSDLKAGAASAVGAFVSNPSVRTSQSWSGTIAAPPNTIAHLSVSQAKADSIALSKLYQKINSELSHLGGAAAVAEFGDVIRQFGKPFDAIIDLTNRRLNRLELERRGLKGSAVFKKIRWAQIVASTYLEYSFGLAPLISDTEKAAEALARFKMEVDDGKLSSKARLVSRGENILSTESVQLVGVNNTWLPFRNGYHTESRARCQYTVGMKASLQADIGSQERLLQLCGFKPADWIPAVWEVVPWSWLIDYFANVQQILAAAATSTKDVTWVCKTVSTVTKHTLRSTFRTADCKAIFAANSFPVREISGSSGGSWDLTRTTVTRTVPLPGSLGVPPLYFKLPVELGKLANMAAVLVSRRPSASRLWVM
jgi:hypothetical protein